MMQGAALGCPPSTTVARPQRQARQTPAIRRSGPHVIWLCALGFAMAADAAVVFRWVDKQGNTHFGDVVPSEYKGVARPVDDKALSPSPEEQRRALERVTAEKVRAADAGKATPPASTSSRPAPAASAAVSKRPAKAPTDDTDCDTWRRLYRESLDCFAPYRTVRSTTKAEAFEHCTPVTEPPVRCGRDAR